MPESPKNTNETAIRRKRIFQLFKKFHPDVLSGSGYENEAGELAKVLTAILDLEINEEIPKEFRGKLLTIVFVDEDGRSLRSKSPLLITASQEEFLSDLEYIITNKKMPGKKTDSVNTFQDISQEKSDFQKTSTASDAYTDSTTRNGNETSIDRLIIIFKKQIEQIAGPSFAAYLIENIRDMQMKVPQFHQDGLDLIMQIQEKMKTFVLLQINGIVGDKSALRVREYIQEWEKAGLISIVLGTDLKKKLQVKFMKLVANLTEDIVGPKSAAHVKSRIEEYKSKELLTSEQVSFSLYLIETKLNKLRRS